MKKTMQAGMCPICGKQNLDYNGPEFNGESVIFNFTCQDCNNTGYEESHVSYIGTVINDDEKGEVYYDADTEVTILYKRAKKK
jgi:predicted nucleic-acid-binding Zn-ribbon protein